jgi:hypothetical protein
MTPVGALSEGPVGLSLGGGARAANSREAMYFNPATAARLTEVVFTTIYQLPAIPDQNAGGRYWSVSTLDGGSAVKGGVSYSRISRARLEPGGIQGYEDRTEFASVLATPVTSNLVAGLRIRYVTRRIAGQEKKFIQGDGGIQLPLYQDLFLGMTYNGIRQIDREPGRKWGVGLSYPVAEGITLFADGERMMSGPNKSRKGWTVSGEAVLGGDWVARASRAYSADRGLYGWAAGGSWNGPRASLDYAWSTVRAGSFSERKHTFGVRLVF